MSNLPQARHGPIQLALHFREQYRDVQQIISWKGDDRSRGEARLRMEAVLHKRRADRNTHSSRNGQWPWVVLPLPPDYLMVCEVDEEKLSVAASREVMWYVESLARAAFDTSDVDARLGWNERPEGGLDTQMTRGSDNDESVMD